MGTPNFIVRHPTKGYVANINQHDGDVTWTRSAEDAHIWSGSAWLAMWEGFIGCEIVRCDPSGLPLAQPDKDAEVAALRDACEQIVTYLENVGHEDSRTYILAKTALATPSPRAAELLAAEARVRELEGALEDAAKTASNLRTELWIERAKITRDDGPDGYLCVGCHHFVTRGVQDLDRTTCPKCGNEEMRGVVVVNYDNKAEEATR